MPTIAVVDGIRIEMYWNDHPPPHFHARLGDRVAKASIATATVIDGALPPAATRRIMEWTASNRDSLAVTGTEIRSTAWKGGHP